MDALLDVNCLTVELPTARGWVRPVNDLSLRIAAGRNSGLKDVKVVGFSPTHTALKFVIPLAER